MPSPRVLTLAAIALLLTTGVSCRKGIPADVARRLQPVALEWWGVQDTESEVAPLIAEYQKIHPHVAITYRKFRLDEYEDRLLNALAERDFTGPDLFAIPSSWTRKYRSKLLPAPAFVTMPFRETVGTVKKEVIASLRSTQTVAPADVRNVFVDVVADDVVLPTEPVEGQPSVPAVYGLPLSVDTLVLYANRSLLNAAGIPEPAKTWDEFRQHIPRLTKRDTSGALIQSGAAIGTAGNVQRSFDLLSLLMMQGGAVMRDAQGQPRFHEFPPGARDGDEPPGARALSFYTAFANPAEPVYTWNAQQPDSVEAFVQGRVAYLFGYSYHRPIITGRAPRMNLSVTGAPHIAAAMDLATGIIVGSDVEEDGRAVGITYANFWVHGVSERTAVTNEAWDFLTFAATRGEVVAQYLVKAVRPTALRRLIGSQLEDPVLRPFAAQLLTARTWYRGRNPEAAERVFADLITDVVAGRATELRRAVQVAAQRIEQTL